MRMTRNKLFELLEESVRRGCVGRISAVLAAQGRDRCQALQQAKGLVPRFTIVLGGFEEVIDKNGEALVEASGEVQVLFGDDKKGVHLEALNLEFRSFTIRVKDGYYLGVNDQPTLFDIVETLAHLPTQEAVINLKTATIHFYRPLNGWEGFFLCLWLDPAEPYWLEVGDLTQIDVAWD
jgi:hypothetical protein